MNSTTILNRYTDFISDKLPVYCWGFSVNELKKLNASDYSIPVRIAVLNSLLKISNSANKRICERAFTVFIGDYGDEFENFAAGIRYSTDKKVKSIHSENLNTLPVKCESFEDNIRYIHLLPEYRYSFGKIYQYTYDDEKIGKRQIEDSYETEAEIQYRKWLSAESFDVKEKYFR